MNNFSNLNHLPADLKILIVNGQTLVNEAKAAMKDPKYRFDLTSKMQLKTDCREVEKYIKLIANGKLTEKNKAGLESASTRLKTNLTGIIGFYLR